MPRQFDLKEVLANFDKAKSGELLVTRDGQKCKFVAHVPEAKPGARVVFLYPGGEIGWRHENGRALLTAEMQCDLFLADKPKVKKSQYIFLYRWKGGNTSASIVNIDGEVSAREWCARQDCQFLTGDTLTWEEEA